MHNEIAIKVDNLTKAYHLYDKPQDRFKEALNPFKKSYHHDFYAVNDISFEIKKGETVGIIGKNGAGKSTLLKMITGVLTPTSGNIQINGKIASLLELGAGFNPEMTGLENIYLNGTLMGFSQQEMDTKVDAILEFADIGEFIDQPVKAYSSGMMMRLAFAVAINVEPQILIIDEALSVGDELFQRKCFARIEAIKKNGATILFVSHSASAVIELCDYAILLNDGEKLMIGMSKIVVGKYQKLIYAPLAKRVLVIEEIRSIMQNNYQDRLYENTEMLTNDTSQSEQADEKSEVFDPHLVAQSTFEYESHGVYISNPQIKNLQDRRINNLVRNRKYKYSYKVKFDRAASNVRFGMVVKTNSGFHLGGALSVSSLAEAISYVDVGDSLLVEFTFNCYLNPGLYFLNAGVFGSTEQEETVLHRIVDAVVFRVLPLEHNLVTEIIDFGFVPRVTIDA